MRILILGAGAVGLCVAAKLSEHATVYAVCRKKYTDAIAAQGFVMSGIWGEGTFRFPCGESVPEGSWDYIIISPKSAATREVCEVYGDAEVVSLQKRYRERGADTRIHRSRDRCYAMIITWFEWRDDNVVFVSVDGCETVFGRFSNGTAAAVQTLADLFGRSGMRSVVSRTVQSAVWSKALYSCSLNPLGAVMGCPYGNLLKTPVWSIIMEIVQEAFLVSRAEGVKFMRKTVAECLSYLKSEKIPFRLQDTTVRCIRTSWAGRMTKVDYINGAIVRLGEEHGIATLVNRMIVNLTHFKEELR